MTGDAAAAKPGSPTSHWTRGEAIFLTRMLIRARAYQWTEAIENQSAAMTIRAD